MTLTQLVELNYKSIELTKILYKKLGDVNLSDTTNFNEAAEALKTANQLREFVLTKLNEEKQIEEELEKQAKEAEAKKEQEEMIATDREVESDMITVHDSLESKDEADVSN